MFLLDDFTVPGGCGDSECSPHERAIEGPATKPTAAPATAPIGPKTNAPDTAPSAALPTRSLANARPTAPPNYDQHRNHHPFHVCPLQAKEKKHSICWARQRLLLGQTKMRDGKQAPGSANSGHRPAHSITSSARAGNVGGLVMPIVLAVFRLITGSYLVGACTGSLRGD